MDGRNSAVRVVAEWHRDRLPTAADADLHGLVRWGPNHPGLMMPWHDVRPGESWTHTSAWRDAEAEPMR
jgi:hypothetical protein